MGCGREGGLGVLPAPWNAASPAELCSVCTGREGWKAGTERGRRAAGCPCLFLSFLSLGLSLWPPLCLSRSLFFSFSPSLSGALIYFTSYHSFCLSVALSIPVSALFSVSLSLCVSLCIFVSILLCVSVFLSLSSFSLHPSPPYACPPHIPILTLAAYILTWPSGVLAKMTHEGSVEKGIWAVETAHTQA